MKQAERPVLHRWTRHEYERLIDHGFLDEDDRIELLDGLLLVKEPQFLDDRSEPEPDVAVIHGSPRDYVDAHPMHPALVVEVAQSGLGLARGRKAVAYARAPIADYWIVNLVDRVLEV